MTTHINYAVVALEISQRTVRTHRSYNASNWPLFDVLYEVQLYSGAEPPPTPHTVSRHVGLGRNSDAQLLLRTQNAPDVSSPNRRPSSTLYGSCLNLVTRAVHIRKGKNMCYYAVERDSSLSNSRQTKSKQWRWQKWRQIDLAPKTAIFGIVAVQFSPWINRSKCWVWRSCLCTSFFSLFFSPNFVHCYD